MRKHGGTPSRRGKHVTLAAISPPGVARGRFVGGQQSGLAGCKPPPLLTRGASSCSSQGRRQGEPWGASPRPSAPTYLPTSGIIADRRATKPNDLHVPQSIYVLSPRDSPVTRPAADLQQHTDCGRSGEIGGRQATKPPARTCIQKGGARTPAAAPRSHSDAGAPGNTYQEGNHAQPHKYGDRKPPARATPRHHAPANEPRPGPRRRLGSTTRNTTRRVNHRPAASCPDTGQPGAPPAPQPASPTDGGPHTRAV